MGTSIYRIQLLYSTKTQNKGKFLSYLPTPPHPVTKQGKGPVYKHRHDRDRVNKVEVQSEC